MAFTVTGRWKVARGPVMTEFILVTKLSGDIALNGEVVTQLQNPKFVTCYGVNGLIKNSASINGVTLEALTVPGSKVITGNTNAAAGSLLFEVWGY